MQRQTINFLTALALFICTTPISYAQDNRFSYGDPFANRNAAHVGLYLKIPFSGGLKNFKKDKLKFGATLGFKRNHTSNFRTNMDMLNSHRQFTVNVVDLKFNEHGFKTISLVGQDIRGLKKGDIIYLKDKEGKVTVGKVLIYGLAGFGLLIVVALAVMAVDYCSRPFAGFGTDRCD